MKISVYPIGRTPINNISADISEYRPIFRYIGQYIAYRGPIDRINAYLHDLSLWPIYRLSDRFLPIFTDIYRFLQKSSTTVGFLFSPDFISLVSKNVSLCMNVLFTKLQIVLVYVRMHVPMLNTNVVHLCLFMLETWNGRFLSMWQFVCVILLLVR